MSDIARLVQHTIRHSQQRQKFADGGVPAYDPMTGAEIGASGPGDDLEARPGPVSRGANRFMNRAFGDDLNTYGTGEAPLNGALDLPQHYGILPGGRTGPRYSYVESLRNPLDAVANDIRSLRRAGRGLFESAETGATAAKRAMTGELPMWDDSGHTSQQAIQDAFDLAATFGGGASAAGTADRAATGVGTDLRVMGRQMGAGTSTPEDINAFIHRVYGQNTRSEIDQFIAAKDAAAQPAAAPSTALLSDSAPGAALAAVEHAPKFYSALGRAVEALPEQTLTGAQWLTQLWEPGTTKKVGVRDEKNRVVKDETGQPVTKDVEMQGRSPLPGVKQEELEHSGVLDFLQQNAARPVTKAEVVEHLNANKLELGEVNKAGQKLSDREVREHHDVSERLWNEMSEHDRNELRNLARENTYDADSNTEFHGYQLPGGENYREKLLTLPRRSREPPEAFAKRFYEGFNSLDREGAKPWDTLTQQEKQEWIDSAREQQNMGYGREDYRSSHWDEPNVLVHRRTNEREVTHPMSAEEMQAVATRKAAQGDLDKLRAAQDEVARKIQVRATPFEEGRKREIIADLKAGKITRREALAKVDEYVPNPDLKPLQDRLQVLRAQEDQLRDSLPPEPKNSKRSLHIEEIQSDWHQQGRKRGYNTRPNLTEVQRGALLAERDKIVSDAVDAKQEIDLRYNAEFERRGLRNASREEKETFWAPLHDELAKDPRQAQYDARINELNAALGEHQSGVPDAPFKKSWHELALKDAIREAAEKGFDRISWTPGEAQAARYDLSKHIERMKVYRSPEGGFSVNAWSHGSENPESLARAIPLEKLPDYVGKDLAERIAKDADKITETKGKDYSGLDLKVGGEGMKGFYDKMIPDALNKIGKPHGVKVQSGTAGSSEGKVVPRPIGGYRIDGDNAGVGVFSTRAGAEAALAKLKQPVHYMDIPQSLKDQALKKGFSLFEDSATAGAPLAAVAAQNPKFRKWFGKSQVVDSEGKPLTVFHGTTGEFDTFNKSKAGVEADWGAGFYFSNTPKDVEHNYAGFGPDLTNKIERRVEQMGEDVDPAEARAAVLADLAPHEGATMPVFLRMVKPFKVGGKDETFLDYEGGYNHKTEEYDLPESGKLVEFINALRKNAADHDADPSAAIEKVMEEAMDGEGISASKLQEILRADEKLSYATDPSTGDSAPSEVIRRSLQDAGFDGVIDRTVNKKFGSEKRIGKPMEGMEPDTVHYIAFEPTQIKSASGNSGAFDPKNASIIRADASHIGAPLAGTEQSRKRRASGGRVGYEGGGMIDDDAPVFDPAKLAAAAMPVFNPAKLAAAKSREGAPMDAMDVASGAVENLPGSAWQFAKDVARPVTHPVETLSGIKDLGLGLLEKSGAIGTIFPSAGGGHEGYADAMGQYLKNRYGGLENIKRTVAKDPVGALSDASMVLTGGGSAAARLPGALGRAGEITGAVGRAVDPVLAPVNAARAGTKAVGELMTHTGATPLENAYRAGVEGGDAGEVLRGHMRGTSEMTEPVQMAREGLEGFRKVRAKNYNAGRDEMTSLDRQMAPQDRILDFSKIDDAVDQARKVQTFGTRVLDKGANEVRNAMISEINEWKALDPIEYHTIDGMDALKRSLGHMMMDTQPGTSARKAAGDIYNAVKKTIVEYDPKYAKVMKDYEQASTQVRELERAMSLGEKASADTALRKLQSIMRNNVNTNYGRRLELGQLLQESGATHLMAALSGQALNAWAPRGLGKLGAELAVIGGAGHFISPWTLAATPLMSPRLMGEVAHAAGRTAGRALEKTNNALSSVGLGSNRTAGNVSYRLGRATNPDENATNPYAP